MVFPFFRSKKKEQQKTGPPSTVGLEGEPSSNPQVFIKLAEHFLRENKPELAVAEYLNAAKAFLEKRQTQLAMAVYRNIITIDPERYSVYETLAELYRMAGFHGDGASVLLALAYQYKTAGCDSEVKRVLDSVLEFSPDNPVLKRKVQAFYAAEGLPGPPAQPGSSVSKSAAASEQQAPALKRESVSVPDTPVPQPVAPQPGSSAPKSTAASEQQASALKRESVSVPDTPVSQPVAPQSSSFVSKSASAAEQKQISELQPDSVSVPDTPVQQPVALQAETSALKPVASAVQKSDPVQQPEPDATAKSFFDLQEALSTDASLGFDCDPSSDNLVNVDPESSPFSVLNVVKNIALQDPKQDTPLFHFNLGIAYMQCGEYEQAVDELLSALYGISDKIGCYVRLADCSLKLQRRELACGFLREALDHPDIAPEQVGDVRKRLDEISVC